MALDLEFIYSQEAGGHIWWVYIISCCVRKEIRGGLERERSTGGVTLKYIIKGVGFLLKCVHVETRMVEKR